MRKIFDFLHAIRKFYWRTFKVKTFGVRVMIVDHQFSDGKISSGKIFLVQHRYGDLWVLPGGQIKKGESAENAAIREIFEETNIKIKSFEKVLGEYKNNQEGKDDTVTVFVTKEWEDCSRNCDRNRSQNFVRKWNWEIKESGFFDLENLPEGTSSATKRRVSEYITGSPPMLKW